MIHNSAAIIVGHGSLLSDAGAAMLRIAAQLQQEKVLAQVEGGFLNYNQPTFAEALANCHQKGATTIVVVPYFLIAGAYVCHDLQALIDTACRQHPQLRIITSAVLGTHPLLVQLAQQRLAELGQPVAGQRALLFVAHGTPLEAANLPILQALQQVQANLGYNEGCVGYLDCNQPDIPAAFEKLAAIGVKQIDVLPYFLHGGRHVRKDLPAHFAQASARFAKITIRIARHLDDETILSQICAERILENVTCKIR